jgi:hypothetical protein
MTPSTSHNPSTSTQQSPPSTMSRLRAASSAFPSGLNLRNQYRGLPPQNNTPASSASRSHSFSNTFTTGYPSAPLTAPVDFSLPRTAAESSQARRDFSIPQLSAPMAPSQDFQSAYSSTLSPSRTQHNDRDFGSQGSNTGNLGNLGQIQTDSQKISTSSHEDSSYLRGGEHSPGQSRKRSFTMPGTYGTT